MTEKLSPLFAETRIAAITAVTRQEGDVGYWILIAEGKVTERRKKIVSSQFVFPTFDEQRRLASGETMEQILDGYCPDWRNQPSITEWLKSLRSV